MNLQELEEYFEEKNKALEANCSESLSSGEESNLKDSYLSLFDCRGYGVSPGRLQSIMDETIDEIAVQMLTGFELLSTDEGDDSTDEGDCQ